MTEEDDYDLCAITLERFSPDLGHRHCPVVGQCGHSFTRAGIEDWHAGRQTDEYTKQKSFVPCVYKCTRKWTSRAGEEKEEQYKSFRAGYLVPNFTFCRALETIQLDLKGMARDGMDDDFAKCPRCEQRFSSTTITTEQELHDLAPVVGVCGHTLCSSCVSDRHQQAMRESYCSKLKFVECYECDEAKAYHIDRLVVNRSLVHCLRFWIKRKPVEEEAAAAAESGSDVVELDDPEEQVSLKLYQGKCQEVEIVRTILGKRLLENEEKCKRMKAQHDSALEKVELLKEVDLLSKTLSQYKAKCNVETLQADVARLTKCKAKTLFKYKAKCNMVETLQADVARLTKSLSECNDKLAKTEALYTTECTKHTLLKSKTGGDTTYHESQTSRATAVKRSQTFLVGDIHRRSTMNSSEMRDDGMKKDAQKMLKQVHLNTTLSHGCACDTSVDVDASPGSKATLKWQKQKASCFDKVKHEFRSDPDKLTEFKEIIRSLHTRSSPSEMKCGIGRIIKLFHGKRGLLFELQPFMPQGYRLLPVEEYIGTGSTPGQDSARIIYF